MSTYSTIGSATYSTSFSNGLDGLMNVLPDNTSNQISARNMRDVSLTIWSQISYAVSQIATASGGTSSFNGSASNVFYTNLTPTTSPLGGIASGSTFSNVSVQYMFDTLLYPYTAPTLSLSTSVSILEYGNTTTISLPYSVTKGKNTISSISILTPAGSSPITPILTPTTSGTLGSVTPTLNTTTTFTMSVNDGTVHTTSASVTWQSRRYWGVFPTFTLPTSGQITGLTGAGVGSGSELSTTRTQTRLNMNGSGNYLIFSWPSTFGSPSFTINGLSSNAWTLIGTQSVTNTYSYTILYDVWLSNTIQNSPLASIVIT